jgi:hypothetical protein
MQPAITLTTPESPRRASLTEKCSRDNPRSNEDYVAILNALEAAPGTSTCPPYFHTLAITRKEDKTNIMMTLTPTPNTNDAHYKTPQLKATPDTTVQRTPQTTTNTVFRSLERDQIASNPQDWTPTSMSPVSKLGRIGQTRWLLTPRRTLNRKRALPPTTIVGRTNAKRVDLAEASPAELDGDPEDLSAQCHPLGSGAGPCPKVNLESGKESKSPEPMAGRERRQAAVTLSHGGAPTATSGTSTTTICCPSSDGLRAAD